MKLATFAAAALLLAGIHQASDAGADENWNDHLKVSAQAKGGELRVVLEGADGWFVNTQFPGLKVSIKAPDGVTLDKTDLGKDDAKLEGTEHEGKAKRATFTVKFKGNAKSLEGSYKTVICSPNACSPPIKGTWATK